MDKPKILTSKELRSIMPRLYGWKLARNKLSRTFEFQDFVQSLSFMNSLVAYFETVDHHPDVSIASSPATPAAPTTSTQQTSATMSVVTYTAVIDVDAASQDIPPGGGFKIHGG